MCDCICSTVINHVWAQLNFTDRLTAGEIPFIIFFPLSSFLGSMCCAHITVYYSCKPFAEQVLLFDRPSSNNHSVHLTFKLIICDSSCWVTQTQAWGLAKDLQPIRCLGMVKWKDKTIALFDFRINKPNIRRLNLIVGNQWTGRASNCRAHLVALLLDYLVVKVPHLHMSDVRDVAHANVWYVSPWKVGVKDRFV